ncbi:MAG: Aldo-keto reductase YhdN [Xylophilus sp.]|nr:MAG: Aldo-keto reductase YhdN [Xylophilus sp.]
MSPPVAFPHGPAVPALGLGSWHIGEGRRPVAQEIAALQAGLDAGLRLIDTAEMYGDGRSEELIGRAVAGRRDEVFLVSKVYPHHATAEAPLRRALTQSLTRLGTGRLDLYDLAPDLRTPI